MFFCSCIFCCALRVLFHKFLSLHEKFIYNEHENNFLCKSSQNFQLSQCCCDIMCQLAALSTTLTRILKISLKLYFCYTAAIVGPSVPLGAFLCPGYSSCPGKFSTFTSASSASVLS